MTQVRLSHDNGWGFSPDSPARREQHDSNLVCNLHVCLGGRRVGAAGHDGGPGVRCLADGGLQRDLANTATQAADIRFMLSERRKGLTAG